MPPIFLLIFIIFLIILAYFLRKNTRSQNEIEERFWQREQEANSIRRKDISNLDYITIPLEKFPMNLHSLTEKRLETLSKQTILNLTGYSNTDLKLDYGPANLDKLSEYDNNFSELVGILSDYSKELLDANQKDGARTVLEYAVSICADSKSIYTMLADLYQESGEINRIEDLIQNANELRSLSKNVIVEKLNSYLLPLP